VPLFLRAIAGYQRVADGKSRLGRLILVQVGEPPHSRNDTTQFAPCSFSCNAWLLFFDSFFFQALHQVAGGALLLLALSKGAEMNKFAVMSVAAGLLAIVLGEIGDAHELVSISSYASK
jgi:hypothetical protein